MELFDTRQLRAFQELARQGSFTQAAAQLNLTQSAVSHSIKGLEGHLGIPLFDRLGKQVCLSPAGEAFLPHVDSILSQMHQAREDILRIQQPGHGRLRIGATVTISQYVLPSILRELRECFPHFEITVSTDDSQNLLNLLEGGDIDAAVALQLGGPSGRLKFDQLFTDRIEMALAPVHPLATIPRIRQEDISAEDFIIYDKSSETHALLEQMFTKTKGRLHASLQVGSMAAIKEMAKIGMGVGLLAPWIALDEIEAGTLIFRPLPIRNVSRSWGIYTLNSSRQQLVEEVFTGICRTVVTNLQLKTDQHLAAAEARLLRSE